MIEGLRLLRERAGKLMSGQSVPVIEGDRERPNYHGVGRPEIIHWKSIEMVTNTRKGESRRSKRKNKKK